MMRGFAWASALVLASVVGCGGSGGAGDAAGEGSDGGFLSADGGMVFASEAGGVTSPTSSPYLALGLGLPAGAPAAIYPYSNLSGDNSISFTYRVSLAVTADLYDLELSLPMPEALAGQGQVTVSSGWYTGAIRSARRIFDWVSPDMGTLWTEVTFKRDPHLFGEGPDALKGDLSFSTQAKVIQYDKVLAKSESVAISAYMPGRVSSQDFDLSSGQIDGEHLYVSARPGSGVNNGVGGIYRVAIADGTVAKIASHTARTDQMAPFRVDGNDVFFVTFATAEGNSLVQRTRKDGTGAPTEVPLPANTARVLAVDTDSTHLYLVLQLQGNKYVVFRALKQAPSTDTATSPSFAHPIEDTLALTTQYALVLQETPAQILRFPKANLAADPTKVVDVGSTTGPRSLACSEELCFWTEWTNGGLYQIPVGGGEKTKLQGTNQPILWDGQQIYSGINGLVRVGPNGSPPDQRLFLQGSPIRLLAAGPSHVYFVIGNRIWRIHK